MNDNSNSNDVYIIAAILMNFAGTLVMLNGLKKEVKKEVNGIKKEVNGIKKEVNGLKKEVNGIKKEVNGIKKEVNGLKKEVKDNSLKVDFFQQNGIPYLIDFWDRTIGVTSDLQQTKEQKKTYKYYDVTNNQNEGRKCMFTDLVVPIKSEVCIAHLIPRRAPGWAFESLDIDPEHRNHPKNTLVLCKGIEELFDLKKISFFEEEEGKYRMKIWDEKIEKRPIYKNSDQTIGDFKHHIMTLGVKRPYTRILNHHHKMCARSHGDPDTAKNSSFGTPCKNGSKYPVEKMALKTSYYDHPPNKYPNLCSDDLCSITSTESSLDLPSEPSLGPPLEAIVPIPKRHKIRIWFRKFVKMN